MIKRTAATDPEFRAASCLTLPPRSPIAQRASARYFWMIIMRNNVILLKPKQCTHCGTLTVDFYNHSDSYCKACVREINKANYQKRKAVMKQRETQKCSECGQELSMDKFYTGSYVCKTCRSRLNKKNYSGLRRKDYDRARDVLRTLELPPSPMFMKCELCGVEKPYQGEFFYAPQTVNEPRRYLPICRAHPMSAVNDYVRCGHCYIPTQRRHVVLRALRPEHYSDSAMINYEEALCKFCALELAEKGVIKMVNGLYDGDYEKWETLDESGQPK